MNATRQFARNVTIRQQALAKQDQKFQANDFMPDIMCTTVFETSSFQNVQKIGSGAFGTVYSAKLKYEGQELQVAIKVLDKAISHDSYRAEKMFINECNILYSCDCRKVVRMLGLCRREVVDRGRTAKDKVFELSSVSNWCIVQEFLSKGGMAGLLYKQMLVAHKSQYTSQQALQWAADVAYGLHYLHTADPPTLHRDVKKENVMFTKGEDGRLVAKLVDFGLAKNVYLTSHLAKESALSKVSVNIPIAVAEGVQHVKHSHPLPPPVSNITTPYASPSSPSSCVENSCSSTTSTDSACDIHPVPCGPARGGAALSALAESVEVALPPSSDLPNGKAPPLDVTDVILEDLEATADMASAELSKRKNAAESFRSRKTNSSCYIGEEKDVVGDLPVSQPPQRQLGKSISMAPRALERQGSQVASLNTLKRLGSRNERSLATSKSRNMSFAALRHTASTMLRPKPFTDISFGDLGNLERREVNNWFKAPKQHHVSKSQLGYSYSVPEHFVTQSLAGFESRAQLSNISLSLHRQVSYTISSQKSITPRFSSPEVFKYGISDMAFDLTSCVGSLLYMAPEVYTGKEYNAKADVYSLGILLFELVTQQAIAYHNVHNNITAQEDGLESFAYIMMQGFRPEIPKFVPEPVAQLVEQCWDRAYEKRPSAQEVGDRLTEMVKNGEFGFFPNEQKKGCCEIM